MNRQVDLVQQLNKSIPYVPVALNCSGQLIIIDRFIRNERAKQKHKIFINNIKWRGGLIIETHVSIKVNLFAWN